MANTSIQLKKSGFTGNTPIGLNYGELAINYADGKLYYKNGVGVTSFITNQNTFATVNSNSSLIIATSVSDILTIVPGNNITISTNTTTKTITVDGSTVDNTARISAQASFNKANNALSNTTGAIFGGDLYITGTARLVSQGGDEGGEIFLGQALTNSTLSGGITIDSYQNKIRIFEQGGTARGAYIDLTQAAAGVGTNLLSPGTSTDQYARDTANTATTNAATADSKAVTAGSYANSAFLKANTATTNADGASLYANSAFLKANTADSKAVTAGSYANSAYTQANTATTNAATADSKAVTAGSYANSAYTQANSAYTQANAAYNKANSTTGLTYTANTTPPSSPNKGDQWYNTNTDILYEYITDGSSNVWIDIQSPIISSDPSPNILSPFLLAGM